MKKPAVLFILLALLFPILAGCGDSTSAPQSGAASSATTASGTKKVVKIALNNVPNPPFSYVDDKNQPIGYTVEYLKEVEKRLGDYTFQFDSIDNNSALLGVDTGKYDFSANYWFRNPEREKKYLFAENSFGYSVTALVVKSGTNDIKTLADLSTKKLVPLTPISGLLYILKDYNVQHPDKQISIEYIDNITTADGLKYVGTGPYDAFFVNAHNFEDTNKTLKLDLKIGGIISKEPVWILFNKNQTELAAKFDKVTKELLADGTLPKLAEKWFGFDFFKSLDYIQQGYQYKK